MSMIELYKELETLKSEAVRLSDQIVPMIQKRKRESIDAVVLDFQNFFQGHGYNVQVQAGSITATLGTTHKVSMTIPTPEDNFVGAYSVFKLGSQSPSGVINYIIMINGVGERPMVTTEIYSAPNSEEEKVKFDIQRATNELERSKSRLECLPREKWVVGLAKGDKSNIHDYPQFDTMAALLAALFP